MTWTRFVDMHSGGGNKLARDTQGNIVADHRYRPDKALQAIEHFFIETTEKEAVAYFYNKYGRNPDCVTCTCCGSDYSFAEYPTLAKASNFERGARYGTDEDLPDDSKYAYKKYTPLQQWLDNLPATIHIVRAEDIRPQDTVGEPPVQGYVYHE